MSFMNTGKDRLLSKGLKAALGHYLRDYGTLEDFTIDTTHRCIDCTLRLEGEPEPLRLRVRGYRLFEEGGRAYLSFEGLETSRAWLNRLLENHLNRVLPRRRIELPRELARVARVIV